MEELYAKTLLLKSFSLFLWRTEKQHGILPRFAVGIVMVQSTCSVISQLLSYVVQDHPLSKTSGMTPCMASTASAGALKIGLGRLCQHNFEHSGSQINVSTIEHNSSVRSIMAQFEHR